MAKKFEFHVNGKPVSVSLDNEETPLLNVLRNELGLMGTRFGCGLEQCGCCMVLIDGAPEKCCAKPVWSVAGKKITTVEGLGNPERPHPLQQAFIDEQAANAVTVSPASLSRPRRCSIKTRHRRAPKLPPRSTIISAAAERIIASCVRSARQPLKCVREPRHERAASRTTQRQSEPRSLGVVPFPR
jgi:2Fe-2S iron-sulfur cluster binding domain